MSNETKWTPGPWRVQTMKNGIEHEILHGEYYVAASFGGCPDEGRAGSNAHLIAAAPELYSEIDKLLSSYRQLAKDYKYASGAGGIHPAHQERIDRAMAVMDKARGES